jgi:uncharacterized protein (DUF302 family)
LPAGGELTLIQIKAPAAQKRDQAAKARGETAMSYYFAKTLPVGFDEAVRRTTEALKQQGFGIITEIDVTQTLKAKIGADFRNYRILGACNPKLAHEALQVEDKIGTMLPCNVVVQDAGGNKTEVAAIDPVASMAAIDNPRLKEAAQHVQSLLRKVVDAL